MRRVLVQMGPFLGWSMACLLVAVLLMGVLGRRSAAAPAEEPKFKDLDAEISDVFKAKNKKDLNERTSLVRSIILGSRPLSGNEAAFDEYYLKYLFPGWTRTTEENLGSLAKDRERFVSTDLRKAVAQVHDRLVDLTYNKMLEIAQDAEFHPGVRYNAILILGALNTREADSITKVNPEPLPKALDALLGLYTKSGETDAVRVAALLGILRHLEWDEFRPQASRMAADKRATIVSELVTLAQMTTPPAGRSLEGHTWMRRRAVEGLMYATFAELTPEIAGTIEKLVSSNAEPLALRCTAADTMGRLEYKAPVLPAAEPTALELGYLALVACDAELTRLESESSQQENRTKSNNRLGPGAGGGMGMPGGIGMPKGGAPGAAGGTMGGMMGGMMAGGKPAGVPTGGPGGMGKMMSGMTAGKTKQPKTKPKKDGGAMTDLLVPNTSSKVTKPAEPNAQRLDSVRRRLRAWLYAVQMGLGDEKANFANSVKRTGFGTGAQVTPTYTRGIAAYTQTDEEKKYVKDVITQVQEIIRVVEDPALDQEVFAENLRTHMKALEKITKSLAPPKTEAEEPAGGVPGPAAAKAAPSAPAAKGAEVPAEEVPTAPAAAPLNPPAATPGPAPAAAEPAKGAAPPPAATKSP